MAEKFEYTREWTNAEAFPLLGFTKSWENPEDYPTIELDETQVRKDMQSLHDEVKNYINDKLIPAVLAEDATEASRAAAEAQREANEAQRIENENARIAAEQARVDETNGVVAQANKAAQSWAVGGTGTREGEDTNNAKYWSDKAREAAGGDFVPTSEKGSANGVATLGADALLAAAQRPKAGGLYRDDGTTTVEASLAEISTTLQKKADLGEDGKVPAGQVDAYSKSESISAETRTALSLPETATPDAALAEIARQLSESGGLKLVKRWENTAPTSSFAAQKLSIDLADAKLVLIKFGYHSAMTDVSSSKFEICPVGDETAATITVLQLESESASATATARRTFKAEIDGITFSTGAYQQGTKRNLNDAARAIPLEIYSM